MLAVILLSFAIIWRVSILAWEFQGSNSGRGCRADATFQAEQAPQRCSDDTDHSKYSSSTLSKQKGSNDISLGAGTDF